jgi:hypothetical protein
MAVYVDSLRACLRNPNWKWHSSCHLIADTVAELHAFARGIGMKREWFQMGSGAFPHYDLTPGKRKEAVAAGAVEIDRHTLIMLMKRFRRAHEQGVRFDG